MRLAKDMEALEYETLSPYACKSGDTKGRERYVEKCRVRTEFQRDRDRILHSKAFRRLKHKTQVFLAPVSDHHRTRLTHTLEVSQISRTIARALRMNEDLTEAIALGHDLGHTPFGHMGERTLDQLTSFPFSHNAQSLRVAEALEGGMNLTWEVRDGIANHKGNLPRATLEAEIVHISDRVAYVNHDLDDALRAGVLEAKRIPPRLLEKLGENSGQRINAMVLDVIENSDERDFIAMSEEMAGLMGDLRAFLFENVYQSRWAVEEERKAGHLIRELFAYLCDNPLALPDDFMEIAFHEGMERAVCDYIAGMTDQYAIAQYKRYLLPKFFAE